MKSETEIRKQKQFLESQKEIFGDLMETHPYADGAKQILKDIEHDVEILKWVLNEPSRYGEIKLKKQQE